MAASFCFFTRVHKSSFCSSSLTMPTSEDFLVAEEGLMPSAAARSLISWFISEAMAAAGDLVEGSDIDPVAAGRLL